MIRDVRILTRAGGYQGLPGCFGAACAVLVVCKADAVSYCPRQVYCGHTHAKCVQHAG